jgi:FAD dependent oxidoreductase TIGR03364
MQDKKAIVVGAGIVGLAIARAFAMKGYAVDILDRGYKSTGASIRNFGMVWPVGQPMGNLYERAMRSRHAWAELAEIAGIYVAPVGSLHVARHPEEADVIEAFYEREHTDRSLTLLKPEDIRLISPCAVQQGLLLGLYSADELIVDPREAIRAFPTLWEHHWGVRFCWNETVVDVQPGKVRTARGKLYEGDLIFICSGVDFETLYPANFEQALLTKCKLQMMRLRPQPGDWQLGPALCGGFSLVHYRSFAGVSSAKFLEAFYQEHFPQYLELGIHVMVSQHQGGVLTVGDSHAYGEEHDPFDHNEVNRLVLDYLFGFANIPVRDIGETWHGIYAKMTNGQTEYIATPAKAVYIVNGLGGAGMTLSFGLAEEIARDF